MEEKKKKIARKRNPHPDRTSWIGEMEVIIVTNISVSQLFLKIKFSHAAPSYQQKDAYTPHAYRLEKILAALFFSR